jgi:hypothetical protein
MAVKKAKLHHFLKLPSIAAVKAYTKMLQSCLEHGPIWTQHQQARYDNLLARKSKRDRNLLLATHEGILTALEIMYGNSRQGEIIVMCVNEPNED